MTSIEDIVKNPTNQQDGTSEALYEAYGITMNEDEKMSIGSETRKTFRTATVRKAKSATKMRSRYTDENLLLSQKMGGVLR